MASMNNILSVIEDYLECRKILSEFEGLISKKLSILIQNYEEKIDSAAKSIDSKESYIQELRSELLKHFESDEKPQSYDVEYHSRIEADHVYLKKHLCKALGKDQLSSADIIGLVEKRVKDSDKLKADLTSLLRASRSKTVSSLLSKIKRWSNANSSNT